MDEFFAIALAFPTVLFTVPLVLMSVYWVTVTLGILDIDALGGADAGAEGAFDAAGAKLEGVVDAAAGKLEGAADALTGKAEAAAHAVESMGDDMDGPVVALLSALKLRRAPVTVVLTVLLLVAWFVAFIGSRRLLPHLPLPPFLGALVIFVLALVVAWPLAALVTFPMGPLYKMRPGVSHDQLIGKRVIVSTSRVTETFGEAEFADGGAGLLLQVRCASPNALVKGKEALLVAWRSDTHAFDVEPMSSVLDDTRA